jgi:hypothetical protein
MKGRKNITRVCVDLTTAQRQALTQMIERFNAEVSQAAGIKVTFGMREFFHLLLKQHAEAVGLDWPEDYPAHGGWRGGPKEKRQTTDGG